MKGNIPSGALAGVPTIFFKKSKTNIIINSSRPGQREYIFLLYFFAIFFFLFLLIEFFAGFPPDTNVVQKFKYMYTIEYLCR